jgi:hypothetical protein
MKHDFIIITSKGKVRRSRIRFTREQVIAAAKKQMAAGNYIS